jgi:hypothetical protein
VRWLLMFVVCFIKQIKRYIWHIRESPKRCG